MANIDITEEEVIVIAEAMKVAADSGCIDDEYTAFHLLQRFKREFPNIDCIFDFLDYEFISDIDE